MGTAGREKRQHLRSPVQARVKLSHPTIGSVIVTTRDLSDGGVFLVTEDMTVPPLGSVVEVQVQGLADEAPTVRAEIVRLGPDGIGLRFLATER